MEKHRREPSQLDEVLRLAFPLGSDERRLTKQLIEQGFQINGSCQTDAAIRVATFGQKGGSIYKLPMSATVYWKSEDGVLLWVKGAVEYTGL